MDSRRGSLEVNVSHNFSRRGSYCPNESINQNVSYENYMPKDKRTYQKNYAARSSNRDIIHQMFKYADKLASNSNPSYVLNDPALSKIGSKHFKHADSFFKPKQLNFKRYPMNIKKSH
jgi:hypothetical protein